MPIFHPPRAILRRLEASSGTITFKGRDVTKVQGEDLRRLRRARILAGYETAREYAAALAVDAPANEALILGGEATVQVRGQGRGGRNQELALAAAPLLDGGPPLALAALATDGEDRITGVAGAIATHLTANQAATIGLDITATLADNDSYAFWQALNASGEPLAGGLVERDPTGTNVNDLLIILRYEN